jgi:hypothetical protein
MGTSQEHLDTTHTDFRIHSDLAANITIEVAKQVFSPGLPLLDRG